MPIINKLQIIFCDFWQGNNLFNSLIPYAAVKKYKSSPLAFIIFIIAVFFILIPTTLLPYDLENRVEKFTLSNGLRVLIMERHMSPTVSLYIRYGVGAVDEISGATGTAHFLEHLMFKGTKTIGTKNYQAESNILRKINNIGNLLDREKMQGESADKNLIGQLKKKLTSLQEKHRPLTISNDIDRLYTENGAVDLNASTGQDITTYHVSLPANKLELWARIESDRMSNPVFREFYQERDVIMEERRQSVESNPDGKLMEQFLAAAFPAHPYGRPVLGWPSDMEFLPPDNVMDFYRQFHAPNNTVIAIVGDIKANAAMKIIKKYFGGIKRQNIQFHHITDEPPQIGERRVEILFPTNPQIMIGYHKPALPSYDDYVFDIIDFILGHGRTSRFFKSLVEKKGIAEEVRTTSSFPSAKYQNLFTIFAAPRQKHTTLEIEEELYKEIDKLVAVPVAQEEIEKTKNQLKADFIRALASNSGLASKLSYYEILTGNYQYLINHMKVMEKITPEDIMRTAKKYLSRENRTVATLVKK